MKSLPLFLVLTALLAPLAAPAQETLGNVLDNAGKQLTVDDLKASLVGHSIGWKTPSGLAELEARPNPDGVLVGHARSFRGAFGELHGTWDIKDGGRFCMTAQYTLGPQHQFDFDSCLFWFKAGDDYWTSSSSTDRAAKVLKRTVSK